ncbi:MAG: putative peptidoglycan lipid II flippase [Planctomycetota bacterium]|jgi:putative peptidoglycan lipid II flippase
MSRPEEEPNSNPAAEASAVGADVVGRHKRGLFGRTALISIFTLLSRVLGYAREIIAAAIFGDKSGVFDAFITAWRIPNLFRRFLGEGALSTSFQTALTKVDAEEGEDAGRALFWETMRLLAGILLVVCLITMAAISAIPDKMPVTGWEWLGEDPGYVRDLGVRMMPFVVLVCMAALVSGALNVRGHFAAPAFAPAALNVVWIASLGVAWFWVRDADSEAMLDLARARALAWGVLAAGLVQLVVQIPALRRTGFLGARKDALQSVKGNTGGMTVLKRAAPLAFGAAVYQINVMIDGLMAESLLDDGGPTLHYLANRVQQFPMALIAASATSAVFPALQAHGQVGDRRAVRDLHDRTHRAILFVALPASVGLFALAGPIISVSFERGAFGQEGVLRAAAALRILALTLIPAGAVGLVARTYYSLGDFRSPVRISVVMLLANIGLNVCFVAGMGMDVDGLAAATMVTSWGTLVMLLPGLSKRLELPSSATNFLGPCARMASASIAMGVVAFAVEAATARTLGDATALVLAMTAGVLCYAAIAKWLRIDEMSAMLERLQRAKDKRAGRNR